jgi:mono/diheme cytochrome c family protein
MTRQALLVAALVLGMIALLVSSAFAADPARGEALAKRWCAFCHVVAPDQRAGSPDVPSFAAIARKPDFGAAKVANFLRAPHPVMPNMSLSRSETDDLAAYIATQGR